MNIGQIDYIDVEITNFDNEDDSIDYYMSMEGEPVHWSNKLDQTSLQIWGHGEAYVLPGFIPLNIESPEESIRSFLKVLFLK